MLFVSHEASRTGAPMVLLHFLRWVKEHTALDFEILLLAGGPLVDEFEALAPVHRAEALGAGPAAYVEAGIAKAGFPDASNRLKVARARRSLRGMGDFDVVYLNSTTSAFALQVIDHRGAMVVSHVHELDSAFRYWFPARDRAAMLDATDWYVACADVVGRNLTVNHGVDRAQVSVHHEFVDLAKADPDRGARLREQLGLPAGARLVGGSGQVIWRKGPDLFIQAAAAIVRDHPDLDVHFVWVGSDGDEPIPVAQDLARLGIEDRVHFVGELVDPVDLFAQLDVFCLTSREDPFPLVMLEAAGTGAPIVSFPNGGVVELAGAGDERRAVVVPYLDTDAMAEAVAGLLRDDEARAALARRGRRHILRNHIVGAAAPLLYDDLAAKVRSHLGRSLPAAPGRSLTVADIVAATGADASADGHPTPAVRSGAAVRSTAAVHSVDGSIVLDP